jgi:POT family proton-dependent oligopeptide transporter
MVTKLSVQRVAAMMMGVWFLSSAFAAYAGGMIAGLAAISEDAGGVDAGLASLAVYTDVFQNLAIIAITFGALVLFASPYLHRRMR